MGVIIEIQDEAGTVLSSTDDPTSEVIDIRSSTVTVDDPAPQSVVVEVMQGLPGVQNLYVGPTPPENPEEGWVWIDTSE